jgi:hypothetical protein
MIATRRRLKEGSGGVMKTEDEGGVWGLKNNCEQD